jgi:hypothetical protein
MRLLTLNNSGGISLIKPKGNPEYAILSHTWGADGDEVTYEDLVKGDGAEKNKPGYHKIKFCVDQATRDGLLYSWVDTCCIDKSSSAELSEAINSMFKWYQKATKCYVYLPDVSVDLNRDDNYSIETQWRRAFHKSRWFTRGWTLQELIAPKLVQFFSKEGKPLGDKIH